MSCVNKIWLGWFITSLIFFLTGCSPVMRPAQPNNEGVVELRAGKTLGQTFLAAYDGLNTIEIRSASVVGTSADSRLMLSLYNDPERTVKLLDTALSIQNSSLETSYRFRFTPPAHSNQALYYADFALVGEGKAEILIGAGYEYLSGALYIDHQAVEAQALFQLGYDPVLLILGLLREISGWLPQILIGLWLFLLPGWALLTYLGPKRAWSQFDLFEKSLLSIGMGLSLYPVLFLWAAQVGIHPGVWWVWAVPGTAAIALLWHGVRLWRKGWRFSPPGLAGVSLDEILPSATLVIVILLIFALRFWALHALAAPLWGDSYQHTVMAQRIYETGGLFTSWQPYTPFETMTVQFGFPVHSALWAGASGQPVAQAVLWFGQFANAIAVLAIYPLAMWLSKRKRWAAVAAVVVAGLLSQFPAMYLNWGRYAQLGGQAILPVTLALLAYGVEENDRSRWRLMIPLSVAVAGMLLTYYRMAFYFAAFVPGLMIWAWFAGLPRQTRTKNLIALIALWAAFTVLTLIWAAPWIPNVIGSNLADKLEQGLSSAASLNPWMQLQGDYKVWLTLFEYVPIGFFIACLVALVIAAWRRFDRIWLVVPWIVLLSAVRAGYLIGLPGANLMQSAAVLIALYIPMGLLAGWLFAWLVNRSHILSTLLRRASLILIIAIALMAGVMVQQKVDGGKRYQLVTYPDLRAMDWIKSHTPKDAMFLVESFRIYGGTSVVGSDAGWWIPLLAGRQTMLPPQYALLNERPEHPGYTDRLIDLITLLEQVPPGDPQATQALCDWGITHIYIGQQQGMASNERTVLFTPQMLEGFPIVYAQDRIRIYTFDRGICP